ncbi:MAG TPA: hypothetical protein VKY27_10135 [Bacteriovoracaceae bacterium]|nr:hypothetical protein [Bacteriovoracaceae bacterium]
MKILKAVLIMGFSLGLLLLGLKIFSKIHCRQEAWYENFRSQTGRLLGLKTIPGGSCKNKGLYRLSLRLGEGI